MVLYESFCLSTVQDKKKAKSPMEIKVKRVSKFDQLIQFEIECFVVTCV